MSTPKRIAILTGGGDVPGLNAVIKSVSTGAPKPAIDVLGLRRGWEGLTHVQPDCPTRRDPDYLRPLDRIATPGRSSAPAARSSTPRGRTRARCQAKSLPTWLPEADRERFPTARTVYDLTPVVLDHLAALGIDVLVTIGGDDTLSFARSWRMPASRSWPSPRRWTTTSRGPSTASGSRRRSRGRRRRSTGSGRRSASHERIGVFRIFGRDAGFSALSPRT